MKVALIFPKIAGTISDGSLASAEKRNWLTDQLSKHLFGFGRTHFIPPMALLSLAAVTPSSIELTIVDERIEAIDFDQSVDVVGISVITLTALRAYDISARYRKRGIPVVLGGIHPTVLPHEALQHADTVVVGEGEEVWPQLLHDACNGGMQRIYRGKRPVALETLPAPRFDLLSCPGNYITTKVVRATRGCPYGCTFCTVGTPSGRVYRKRPISKIISEISTHPGKYLIFLDDNLGVDMSYAKRLFQALKPLKLKWYAAVSLNAIEDSDFIQSAADAGCIFLGIGFESLSRATLKAMGKLKTNDPDRYRLLIQKIHDCGIAIVGYFLLGYDTDRPHDYERLGDFILETGIEIPSISALTPYPGSAIYRKLEHQSRILHRRWNLYYDRWGDLAYQTRTMTQGQMHQRYLALIDRLFSSRAIMGRSLPHLIHLHPMALTWILQQGFYQKKIINGESAVPSRDPNPSLPGGGLDHK